MKCLFCQQEAEKFYLIQQREADLVETLLGVICSSCFDLGKTFGVREERKVWETGK